MKGSENSATGVASVSVMIFTMNEEVNITRCLDSVTWSEDIIVIDSGSTDRTLEFTARPNVRVYENKFEGFGKQRNWALNNTSPKFTWVLILDADERVTPELADEIRQKTDAADSNTAAFKVRRRFFMWGRWLRFSNLYPTWVVRLIHRNRVRYLNRGHGETQEVDGTILDLKHDLIDENHKGIDAWFERHNLYATQDALLELGQSGSSIGVNKIISSDPLQRRAALKRIIANLPARPVLYFLYSYILRGGFLEGRDGLTFCSMRALYQGMVSVKKYDLKKRR